jgi:hypothetical protein
MSGGRGFARPCAHASADPLQPSARRLMIYMPTAWRQCAEEASRFAWSAESTACVAKGERRAARRRIAREHAAAPSMRDDDPLLAVTVPSLAGAPAPGGALPKEQGDSSDDGVATHALDVAPSVPYRFFLDLYRGVVHGAYALDDLHAPGALAWILMGFVPGVGTLAALRDGYYSFEVREWGAFLLNLLGLIPFVKGFGNLAQAASLHRLRHTAHVSHQVARVAQRASRTSRSVQRSATVATGSAHAGGAVVLVLGHDGEDSGPRQNGLAWPAVLLALITFAVAPLYVIAAGLLVGGQSLLAVSAPLPIVIAGAVAPVVWCLVVLVLALRARRSARHMRGRPFARPGVSALAVWLGLVALLFTALAGAAVLLVALPLAHL